MPKENQQRPNFGPKMGPGGPGKMRKGEKAKNFKQTWKELIQYSNKYMIVIIMAFIFSIIGTIITVISPDKLSEITDLIGQGIMTGIDTDKILSISTTLAILYVIGAILTYLQGYIMATVTQKITKQLREDISDKINKIPLRYFDKTTFGDVLSRITNDVDMIGQTLNQSIVSLVSAVTLFVGSIIMMLTTNITMTITAVVSTIIGFGFMMSVISKSQKYFIAQQSQLGMLNGHIEEVYTGQSIVNVYNAKEEVKNNFVKMNDDLRDSAFKSQFISGLMMPMMMFVGNFGYVAVCVVGAILVFNNEISFGVIIAFMLYIRLFTQPLSSFAQAATTLQSTAAASERVFEFLREEEMEDEAHKTKSIDNISGDIEFKNVKFGYNKDKLIIKDFSAKIKAGEKVAIVGPTGAGKTTIVNLLMRFYDINSGEIKIDGVSTKDINRDKVHELFSMVLQDTWLFEGTVKENIVYNKKNISDETIINACKSVGIHHFIRTLPKGYDTVLDDTTNLSQGQKQLLTIARAMVADASLLILDEATSSIDTRTEVLIQKAMDKLMLGRTSFIIAHRLSTIKNADVILVMNDGDIIESGSHDELIQADGFYADLYNSQFESIAQ